MTWINTPSMNVPKTAIGGDTVRSHVSANIAGLSARNRRADSGFRLSSAALAWRGFANKQIRQTRDANRADSEAVKAEDQRALEPFAGFLTSQRRADAASYYEHDLVAEYPGAPIQKGRVPASLLAAVPVQNVDVGAQSVRLRFVEGQASVKAHSPGMTEYPLAGATRTEGLREMHAFVTGYAGSDWRQRQHQNYAGYNDDAVKADACTFALEDFLSREWLVSGSGNLDAWNLGNIPVARYTSALTYGTDDADDVMGDFEERLQSVAETTRGVQRADRLMISNRILHRIASYQNYEAGGPSDAMAILMRKIASYGYTIQIVDDLWDLGGTRIDGMVFYSSGPNGLRHLVGLQPAPVDTFQTSGVDVTVMAAVSGGLVCPHLDSTQIHEIPVSERA